MDDRLTQESQSDWRGGLGPADAASREEDGPTELPSAELTPAGIVEVWHPQLTKLTGWPANQVLGKRLSELVVALQAAGQDFDALASYEGVVAVRGFGEGLPRPALAVAEPLPGGRRRVVMRPLPNLGTVESLDESAHALDVNAQRLAVFQGQHPCFCYTVDLNLKFTSSAGSGLKALGLQDGQVVGVCLTEMWGTREPGYEPLACHFLAMAGILSTYQDVCMDRSLEYQLAPLKNTRGQVVGVVSVGCDVTERERLKAENRKLTAQLRQAQKMEVVGQLAGGIAHDFNNLLTCIMGNMSMAARSVADNSEVATYIAEAEVAVDSAANLTRQLLAFSRKQVIVPQPLNLGDLVARLSGMLQKLLGQNITLRVECEAELPAVLADPGQLEQVLVNLVLNARDAIGSRGQVAVVTGTAPGEATSDNDDVRDSAQAVVLTVSDTGSGMAEWVRARLFEPFFTTKPQGEGTGLGLATVHGAIEQNGGTIQVESELGKGTCFRITLPAIDAQAVELRHHPARSESGRELTGSRGTETILLVEDEPLLLDLARCALEDAGYEVLPCADADEALRVFSKQQARIELLITDVIMPRMNGKELAARILSFRPELPLLFTSGYGENIIATRGVIDSGMHFMSKPYRPAELVRRVRHVLDGVQPQAAH